MEVMIINGVKTNHEFTIYNKILDYKNYVEKYIICNIPRNNRNIRIHFLDEVYNLSKNMFYAVYNKGNIRIKYLVEMQVNISLLDMLTSELKIFPKIPNKKLNSATEKLSDIKNIVYAWKLNEESKKKTS